MQDYVRLIFSCITVISALIFLGLIILLHFFPNKYNPIKNTVSDYAVRSSNRQHVFIAVAMTLAGAVTSLSLALAITSSVMASMYAILFLIIASIFRFLLIFFPTDITGQSTTKTGRIHLLFAMIAFTGIAFAAGNFHITAIDEIIGQAVVFTAVLLLLGFLPYLKKIFGLLERIFLFSSIIWFIIVGSELFFKG